MRERHGTPFEHSIFTFYVKAPIFVWREHMRHRIASYNEESGRYRQLDPEFYFPNTSRNLQQVGKTGSYTFEPGTPEQYKITEEEFKNLVKLLMQVMKKCCKQEWHEKLLGEYFR